MKHFQFQIYFLLECGAASLCDWRPTFRNNVVVPSSSVRKPKKNFLTLEDRDPRVVLKCQAPISHSHSTTSQKKGDLNYIAAKA
jgi:hypothetical protein